MVAAWLASIALFVPLPDAPNVVLGVCPQVPQASCAQWDQHTIYLDSLDRDTLAHELGHLWDMQHMTPDARARWAVGWQGSWYFSDLADINSGRIPPAEAFADAYYLCSHSRGWRRRNGLYGFYNEHFKKAKIAQTCWLLDHPPR